MTMQLICMPIYNSRQSVEFPSKKSHLEYLADYLVYLADYLEYLADYLASVFQWLIKIHKPLDYLPGFLDAIKCFKTKKEWAIVLQCYSEFHSWRADHPTQPWNSE